MKEELKNLPQETMDAVMSAVDDMELERTVAEVLEMLDVTQKGQVANTPGNYNKVFLYDPLLRGAFSMNLLTEQIDVVKPLGWYRDCAAITDVDIQYLLLYLDKNYGLSSDKRIERALKVAANEFRRHPIREYLNRLEWDGKERVRYAMHHFLGAEVSDYNYELLRLFMLGAVARVFKPGIKFDVMLCFAGEQGAGKSTFFRLLAVDDDWFTDDLQKLDDENVYRKIQGHWIIEMSEMMATATAKSIESIKAFLSKQKETYKTPYDRHPKDRLRQCVFCGSSNTMDFLPLDRSGNRRFLPVRLFQENAEVHILDNEAESRAYIDQMWAEIMEIYRTGDFKLRLSPEAEQYMKEHQKDFMPEDTKAIQLLNYLDSYKGSIICSLQIYYDALGHSTYDEPKQFEIRDIHCIMNNYANDWKAFENPRHFPAPYNRQKGWERLPGTDNGEAENGEFQKLTEEEARQLELPSEWLNP